MRSVAYHRQGVGFALALVLALSAATPPAAHAAQPPTAPLYGTFIQLNAAHGTWELAQWQALFGYLTKLRIRQLFVQWSLSDGVAFFDTSRYGRVERPPLETILTLADAARMEVFIGLSHDSRFWQKTARSTSLTAVYLRRRLHENEALAQEVMRSVGHQASFRGWYITDEVDDVHWRNRETRAQLTAYLRDVVQYLKQLTPVTPVAISSFASGGLDPDGYRDFWESILQTAPLDLLLFQDGVGAQNLHIADVAPYLNALEAATRHQGRTLQVVVELFDRQQSTATSAFAATPAPLDRIQQQLRLANKGGARPIAFSIPDYMTPLAGSGAQTLYEAYLKAMLDP
jgi:hypothetical protein